MKLHRITQNFARTNRGGGGPRIEVARQPGSEWCINKSWRKDVLDAAAPDWFALDGDGRVRPIKSGLHRKVWRVELPRGGVYAKVHSTRGIVEALRDRFTGSKGEREWRIFNRAKKIGVPVPKSIGVGVRTKSPSTSVFLSQEVVESKPLASVWLDELPKLNDGDRRRFESRITRAVAELFAVAHDRGFFHRDAHPGNVLLSGWLSEEPRALFTDVYAARFKRGVLSTSLSIRSLAQVAHFFRSSARLPSRVRFLKAYLRHRGLCDGGRASRGSLAVYWQGLVAEAGRHGTRLASQRDRRLSHSGKYFANLTLGGGWTATVCLTLERRHRFPEPGVPDRSESDWRALLEPMLSKGLGGPVASPTGEEYGDRSGGVAVEICRVPTMWSRLLLLFTASSQRRAFLHCHRLRHRDIASDLILGVAEHRTGGIIDATALLRPA